MNKPLVVGMLLLISGIPLNSANLAGHHVVLSKAPLSAEQLDVYSAALNQPGSPWKRFAGDTSGVINLVNVTSPLDLNQEDECLKGIHLVNLSQAGRSVHRLGTTVADASGLRLLDSAGEASAIRDIRQGRPGANLLRISEIAFDQEHRYAVMSYTFTCGTLCGNAQTVVFVGVGQQWKESDRKCTGVIF